MKSVKKFIVAFALIICYSGTALASSGNTTGVKDEKIVMIYPKLTEGIVYVDGLDKDKNILLENCNGETLEIKQSDFNGFNAIDLSNMPNGVYKVIIQQNEKEIVTTIIKH